MCISQLSEKVCIQSWPEISADQESLSVQVPTEGHLHIISLGKSISRFSWKRIMEIHRILLPKSGIQVLACQLPMLSSRPAQYILRAYFHIGKREQITSSRLNEWIHSGYKHLVNPKVQYTCYFLANEDVPLLTILFLFTSQQESYLTLLERAYHEIDMSLLLSLFHC